MPYQDMEMTRVLTMAEGVADEVWPIVIQWSPFAQDTVGKQLVRAADSVGANIAESIGRYHPRDVVNFLYHSRGSLYESKYWLRRARKRQLVAEDAYGRLWLALDELGRALNAYIRGKRARIVGEVKEPREPYRIPWHEGDLAGDELLDSPWPDARPFGEQPTT